MQEKGHKMFFIPLIEGIKVEEVEAIDCRLVNDPNLSYVHDHMVLLESKRIFSMFIWVQTSMMFFS